MAIEGESLGTATIYLRVDRSTMDADITRAKASLAGMGSAAQAQYDTMTKGQQRVAEGLVKQAELIGKSKAESIAYTAQLKVGGALGDEIAQKALQQGQTIAAGMGEASKAVEHFTLNNAMARRELGRMATDLARGNYGRLSQSATTLANSVGLIGLAFSATGAAVVGVTAVLGAFALAEFNGERETAKFNQALLKTGDASGASIDSLRHMTEALAAVDGSYGKARDAVLAVAATGKIMDASMQRAAQSALDYAQVTGASMTEAVAAVASLGEDPVKALEKLDSTYHFLTPTVLGQVAALQNEGKEAQATAVAEKAFADANGTRAEEVVEHLGWMQKAARGVAAVFKEMWNEIMDVGRESSLSKQLTDLTDKLAELKRGMAIGPTQQALPSELRAGQIAAVEAEIKRVREQLVAEGFKRYDAQMAAAAGKEFTDAITTLQTGAAKYEDAGKKAAAEIAKVNKALAAAIHDDPTHAAMYKQQAETTIAGIQAELAKHQPKAHAAGTDGKDYAAAATDLINRMMQRNVDATMKKAGGDAKADAAQLEFQANLDAQLRTKQALLDLDVQSVGMGDKEVARARELLDVQQQREHALQQLERDRARGLVDADRYAERKAALNAYYDDVEARTREHFTAMDTAQSDWIKGAIAAMQNWADEGADVAGGMKTLFTDAFGEMNNALVTFVETGKLNFASLADSIISDLTRIAMKAAESQILSAMMWNFGGSSAATAQAGSIIDSIIGSANGNVFNSPSLSRYSGGVYDSPQFFKFASGGVFGEAGPEAIMPLSRGSDGKLGVKAQGSGETNLKVVLENKTGTPMQAQQTGVQRDGNSLMATFVLTTVNNEIAAGGSTAKVLQGRYGLTRRGVPVGA